MLPARLRDELYSGFMLAGADTADVVAALRRFLHHDWRWYVHLALALADVPDRDLAGVSCPVTVLAARYDILADPRRSTVAASVLPDARVRVLPTSHFLPLEAPRVIVDELELLVERVTAAERALTADSRTSS